MKTNTKTRGRTVETARSVERATASGSTLYTETRIRRLAAGDVDAVRAMVGPHSAYAETCYPGAYVVESRTMRRGPDADGFAPRYYDSDMEGDRTPERDALDGFGVFEVTPYRGAACVFAADMNGRTDRATASPGIRAACDALDTIRAAMERAKTADAERLAVRDAAQAAYDSALRAARLYTAAQRGEADPVRLAPIRDAVADEWRPKVRTADAAHVQAARDVDAAQAAMERMRKT